VALKRYKTAISETDVPAARAFWGDPYDRGSLGLLVVVTSKRGLGTGAAGGHQRLRAAFLGHQVGPGQYLGRRTVVAREVEDLGFGVAPYEIGEIGGVGSLPAVDRLARVAHHADLTALAHDGVEEALLRRVGVLVLVDRDVRPPPPDGFGPHRGAAR
jgi:hypothetical protein